MGDSASAPRLPVESRRLSRSPRELWRAFVSGALHSRHTPVWGVAASARASAARSMVRWMEVRPRSAGQFPIGAGASLEELEQNPHALLARLREREPVSWLPALDGWLVTRRDVAMRVMRDPN